MSNPQCSLHAPSLFKVYHIGVCELFAAWALYRHGGMLLQYDHSLFSLTGVLVQGGGLVSAVGLIQAVGAKGESRWRVDVTWR